MTSAVADLEREEADAAAAFYMDEGFEHYGDPRAWRPSDLFRIGYAIAASNGTRDAALKAEAWRVGIIVKARRRWSAGFYANPFTVSPIELPR